MPTCVPRSSLRRFVGAVVLAVVAMVGITPVATGQSDRPSPPDVPDGMIEALQRDLGLTADEASARLAVEQASLDLQPRLQALLGGAFAGTWFDPAVGLVVGLTDPALAGAVQALGVQPRVVPRGLDALLQIKRNLDAAAQSPQGVPRAVAGWYIDPVTNSVVVSVLRAGGPAAENFLTQTGVSAEQDATGGPAGAVRVEEVDEVPRPLIDMVGGEALFFNNGRCSIGFNVTNAAGAPHLLTAGHCTTAGGEVLAGDRSPVGPVASTSFPGDDFGLVALTNPDNEPTSSVSDYSGSTITVEGSSPAPTGASVCRSGSTTGYRCGTISSVNQTVNYGGGAVVFGLTRTTACAEPGDSGGSFVSGTQAQGTLSGGTGNCAAGGTTFFQPVGEALGRYGLRLTTG